MKKCKKCKIERAESQYYRCKSTKDGLRGSCILCANKKKMVTKIIQGSGLWSQIQKVNTAKYSPFTMEQLVECLTDLEYKKNDNKK